MEPSVIFEDEHVLVIVKPAGFIVNRADTAVGQKTIQEWIEDRSNIKEKTSKNLGKDGFESRAGIVHRLDKETSGVLIIAKTEKAFVELQRQFKEGLVSKVYQALVHGPVSPEEGEINVPIGRLPWNRMRFGILPGGRESKTHYKVLSNFDSKIDHRVEQLSFVEVYPKTGRTHQIRVHFQYLGFPLFADALYGGRKTLKRDRKILPRHFLHAKKISFLHPESGERIEFESDLPEDLQQLVTQLQA